MCHPMWQNGHVIGVIAVYLPSKTQKKGKREKDNISSNIRPIALNRCPSPLCRSTTESNTVSLRSSRMRASSQSLIPYMENPMEYAPTWLCSCSMKAPRRLSWSDANLGRQYYTCERARVHSIFAIWDAFWFNRIYRDGVLLCFSVGFANRLVVVIFGLGTIHKIPHLWGSCC